MKKISYEEREDIKETKIDTEKLSIYGTPMLASKTVGHIWVKKERAYVEEMYKYALHLQEMGFCRKVKVSDEQ